MARARQLQLPEGVAEEVSRGLGDFQLDRPEHEGVPQVPGDDREGRRLQSHGLQESLLSLRLLLGLSRILGAARLVLVQLQSLRRGGVQAGTPGPAEVPLLDGPLSALLQSLHEPHAEHANGAQALRQRPGQDG